MIVRDTKNDLLRISVYDSSDSLPQVLKYLEKVSKVGYKEEEIPEHRKKSLEKRDFDLIGAKTYPVRHFLDNPGNCKMENIELRSEGYESNIQAEIDFDVEMLLVENLNSMFWFE